VSLEAAAHKAVHDLLVGLSGGRIFDRVPDVAPLYPYITVRIDVTDDANTCSNASIVHATVTVFSIAVGSQEAQNLGGQVRAILAPDDPGQNIGIVGYAVSVSGFDAAVYRPGNPANITEGVLSFTYLVDPA
jgi:hypothetical protein